MAKPGPRTGSAVRTTTRRATRERIITAAFDTLKELGFAGTSARTIAERGGFNQTQIFYYFGSVSELFVATLEWSSRDRLASYRQALADITSIAELFGAVEQRLREDFLTGHVKVLAELIGASATDPDLKAEIVTLFSPWQELTQDTIARALAPTAAGGLVPADQAAFAVLALFLGIQQLMNLTEDLGPVRELFTTGRQLATLFDALLSGPPAPRPDHVISNNPRSEEP